ncbi:MAG: hypothetical protein HC933_19635 [Pleurocapsa sp. SU_196_0]|nr:hypothetical protein [Pleurocapsa sp. SU_196_0]
MNPEPVGRQPITALEPKSLEVLQSFGVQTVRFALHETSDEWTLEDICIRYRDQSQQDAAYGDELPRRFREALELSTQLSGFYTAGYFEINVSNGTLTRLDDAFVFELRWWQLDEATQRMLTAAGIE